MKVFRLSTAILALFSLFIVTSSCTSKKSPSDRFLQVTVGTDPEYIDPGLGAGSTSHHIGMSLFESLMIESAGEGALMPALAENYEISDDGLQYTFFIRRSAKWSNGRPVTAHDFVYSWERVLNPKNASQYAFIMYSIKNAHDYNSGKVTDPKKLGFKALDDHTLRVDLENPTPYFLELAAYQTFAPVPKEVVEEFGERWTRPENFVGSGPFLMKENTAGEKIVVVKNKDYWDAKNVKLDGIVFHSIEDLQTGLRMYESGQLDINPQLPKSRIPSLKGRPDYVHQTQWATYYYMLNAKHPVLKNKKVRQALSLTIDREKICDKYLKGSFAPTETFVPGLMKEYPKPKGLGFDPKRAKELLKEAGYEDISKFPKLTILYNTMESHRLIAQVVQQMWKEHLGIEVSLMNEEFKTFLKDRRLGKFDVARNGWNGDYYDPYTFLEIFKKGSTLNDSKWNHPKFDLWLNQSNLETNTKKRFQLMSQAEELLIQEAAIIPIYSYASPYLIKPYVHGYEAKTLDHHPWKYVWMDEKKVK